MRALNLVLTVVLHGLGALGRSRSDLILENLALRQQIAVLTRTKPRARLEPEDRILWVALRQSWSRWRDALAIVKPKTIVSWHRSAFRRYWTSLSRPPGRPRLGAEIRALIVRMASENPTWGAPRIHGELLKLGFRVSQRTMSRYLSHSLAEWRGGALDWQLPAGAARSGDRLHAGHLRRLLREYVAYYSLDRCHLGLEKDAPERRPTQRRPSRRARVVSLPRVGGLQHRYTWREAA